MFTGDTLFSLSCGRLFEGTYEDMFRSLSLIKTFDKETLIYCGHEYTLQNANFCLANDSANPKLIEKISKDFIERMPGKKAIGDIYDDSHIYTASEGAFCGIFYEGSDDSLREVFIKSINQSSLKRVIWISNIKESDEVINLKYLT